MEQWPFKAPKGTKAAEELNPTAHSSDLFDLEGDVHGQLFDEATGKPITNDGTINFDSLSTAGETSEQLEAVDSLRTEINENNPVLHKLNKGKSFELGNDAAGKWLRENDPKNKR